MATRSGPRLGILDFLWTSPGQDAAAVIAALTGDVATAEALGFDRYWLGEHHAPGYATGSTLALLAWAASRSSSIRLGSGAALLAYHSPLRLVEEMRIIKALSGRADLGVGRGRADRRSAHDDLLDGRPWTAPALMPEVDYSAKLEHLVRCLANDPAGLGNPELWICGSATAAEAAARHGARFCYTLFHPGKKDPALMDRYRDGFRPSRDLAAPIAAIALCGTWAENDVEAKACAEAHPHIVYHPSVIGGPDEAARLWDGTIERYAPDDVLWLDIAIAPEKRRASWERLISHTRRALH